jgi:hypothetical protein
VPTSHPAPTVTASHPAPNHHHRLFHRRVRTLAITYSSREQTREALLYALLEEPSGRVVADCEGPHMAWLLLSCLSDVRGYLEARHGASLLLRAYPVRGYGKEGRQVCVGGAGWWGRAGCFPMLLHDCVPIASPPWPVPLVTCY